MSPREKEESHGTAPPINGVIPSDFPVKDHVSIFETSNLHPAPSALVHTEVGDYPPIQNFEDANYICILESSKLWAIAAPIAFNILCIYGVNSFTNIFVVHLGDIELSAVALSVIFFVLGWFSALILHIGVL